MNSTRPSVVSRLRQPEYTGENRCLPCTAVNLAITAVAGLAIGLVSPSAGAAFVAVGVAAIYLRGYLVPGTPTLTKRYFPNRVLRWFDKSPATTLEADVDPEMQLLAVDAIEPAGDDLRVTDEFAAEWELSIERLKGDLEARTAEVLALSDAEIREAGMGWAVFDGNVEVARWSSRAALLADVAALPVLRARTANWEALPEAERYQLLAGLRIFLESCPRCGGDLAFSEETLETCCRMREVVRYACAECDAQVLEVEH